MYKISGLVALMHNGMHANIHTHNTQNSAKKEAQNARVTLKAIESLTYESLDGVLLKELNTKLQDVMDDFRSKLPAEDGLVIRSAIQERIERAEKNTLKISSLPTYKPRGRKRLDSAYRNRVGKRADAVRKVYTTHYPARMRKG